jgi:hypothetical protein
LFTFLSIHFLFTVISSSLFCFSIPSVFLSSISYAIPPFLTALLSFFISFFLNFYFYIKLSIHSCSSYIYLMIHSPFYAFAYRVAKYKCGKLIQHCILDMLKYITFDSCLFYYTPTRKFFTTQQYVIKNFTFSSIHIG